MLRLIAGGVLKSILSLTTTHVRWARVIRAADTGDVPGTAALLKTHPIILQEAGSYCTVWHEAATWGSAVALQCLWSAGEHCPGLRRLVDAPNRRGESPLMIALKQGHGEAAIWLLKQGAQPCRWDRHRRCSTFHFAARGGDEAAFVALMEGLTDEQRRAWVNAGSARCHVRPIHYAAALGHARIVRLLLLNGALPNVTFELWLPGKLSQNGQTFYDLHIKLESLTTGRCATALHLAAANGHTAAAVEILYHFHAHGGSIGDPRPLINSPVLVALPWHQTPSQLATAYGFPALGALTSPTGDLGALLAGHERSFEVPSLQALAAAVLHGSLLAGVDAVKVGLAVQLRSRRSVTKSALLTPRGPPAAAAADGAVKSSRKSLASSPSALGRTSSTGGGGGDGSAEAGMSSLGPDRSNRGQRVPLTPPAVGGIPPAVGGVPPAGAGAPRAVTSSRSLPPMGSFDIDAEEGEDVQRCCVCLCSAVELQVAGCRHRMCCECMLAMAARAVKKPVLCPMCRGPVRAVEQLGEN